MTDLCNRTNQLCPQLLGDVTLLTKKYKLLLRLFGACHRDFNKASQFTDDDIKALGTYKFNSFSMQIKCNDFIMKVV